MSVENLKLDTSRLRKFAQFARKALHEQVGTQLDAVLQPSSMERREYPEAIAKLEELLQPRKGSNAEAQHELLVERAAYTWFNRFCALRYMDVNRYTRIGIVSPLDGQFQPEILGEAKLGHMDGELIPETSQKRVADLLSGKVKSSDPQSEVYRILFVAACNYYHKLLPFLFEPIVDYSELLLPADLLSGNSVLTHTREALLPANCSPEFTDQSVEVIGWLYQFYISEKKDDVFTALKKGKKITPENIPAATQLFTPHWIVRYLVENSLGRLWMLNNPDSRLVEQMDYYIKPQEPENDFLEISGPEEIKVCDPACGSGHMLTYAFDLLYAIYEEQGYQPSDIPKLILNNNLYGIEIDQRAGSLAAFALTMKARENYRRFLTSGKVVQPNICVLENIEFDKEELSQYMDRVGRDLFTQALEDTLHQFEDADNFGSLIRPRVTDVGEVLELLRERQTGEDLFLADVHEKVLTALRQADYLSPKYHVVVANPPYMGSGGMNAAMKCHVTDCYQGSHGDLFAAFVTRSCELPLSSGCVAMITMQTWMFIESFDQFRRELLHSSTILSMAHLGERAFDSIGGAVVSTTAFVLTTQSDLSYGGNYFDLTEGASEIEKSQDLLERRNHYVSTGSKLLQLPGAAIAYWLPEAASKAFENFDLLGDLIPVNPGIRTGKDQLFLKLWFEVSHDNTQFGLTSAEGMKGTVRWFPLHKGGTFRRWYGNAEHVINLYKDAQDIRNKSPDYRLREQKWYFKPFVSWSRISTSKIAFRYFESGVLFSDAGPGVFAGKDCKAALGYLNSNAASYFLAAINPTLNFQKRDIDSLPFQPSNNQVDIDRLVELSKADWDSLETSWDFANPALIGNAEVTLNERYTAVRSNWVKGVELSLELEQKNNSAISTALNINEVVPKDVSLEDISLLCNPHYRYGSDKSESELETLLLADTMREFISYAVGCMLGRYSLDKPGLILANQGETADDYRQQIPEPTFAPDEDNVIPLLDGDWFTDDISERFKEFLKVTFGTERFDENLTFLENALYPENLTGKKRKTIRHYFLKEFYTHHVSKYMYKKRPIYWLFSSPKGTFNALIYMHRYRSDTVSVVLNNYLREYQTKLRGKIEELQIIADIGDASKTEKSQAIKDIPKLVKQLKELEDYERDILFPLAQQQIEIDLDDGVKHNYPLFGKALKKVPGLS